MTLAHVQVVLRRLLAVVLLCVSFPAAAQYTNGIYAEFNTSMGSFTCRLDYAVAPKAVANFIGLATGERAWLDAPSGLIKTNPFYDGTTFHRVIAGFMNQGGSRNGQGTDGPGYQFVDEFNTNALHDGFGVLSSANSGPDSNGSQFFITVSPQPHLNNVHTVFGRLHGGSNVVYAINHVAIGSGNKPLTNVVLQTVAIRRIGPAALAFNIHTNGLAAVTNLNLKIAASNGAVSVTFSNQIHSNPRLYLSTNLFDWSAMNWGYQSSESRLDSLVLEQISPRQFVRGVSVQYPPALYVPPNVLNRTVTFNFSGGNGTFVVSFSNSGGGSYTWTLGSGGTVTYNWVQDPYRGRFPLIAFSSVFPMALHLDFDSAVAGTFKGTAYPNYPFTFGAFAVSGIFSASP